MSSHVTRCSTINLPYVAPCGSCHASYQAKLLIEVLAEIIHLCKSNHLSITLLLPVWALGGKVSLLVADKTSVENLDDFSKNRKSRDFCSQAIFSASKNRDFLKPRQVVTFV